MLLVMDVGTADLEALPDDLRAGLKVTSVAGTLLIFAFLVVERLWTTGCTHPIGIDDELL